MLALTMDEVGDRLPVVNGVYADGSHLAARVSSGTLRGRASCSRRSSRWLFPAAYVNLLVAS